MVCTKVGIGMIILIQYEFVENDRSVIHLTEQVKKDLEVWNRQRNQTFYHYRDLLTGKLTSVTIKPLYQIVHGDMDNLYDGGFHFYKL